MRANPRIPSYSKLRKSERVAYENLKAHIKLGGNLRFLLLSALLWIGFHKIRSKAPLVSSISVSLRGMVLSHLTFARFIKNNESDPGISYSVNLSDLSLQKIKEADIWDVIIIGSGPGAATAARVEMENGAKRILVLERGELPDTPLSQHHSIQHLVKDFHLGGQELIIARGFPHFAQANVLGGGSEVNAGLYHELPSRYYDRFFQNSAINPEEYFQSENRIRKWLNPKLMDVNESSSVIARGSKSLGIEYRNIPRWRTYLHGALVEHRGMIQLLWQEFSRNEDFAILTGVVVKKVELESKSLVKIFAYEKKREAGQVFSARKLHVCAGTLESPRILLQSGLINKTNIEFKWHPMLRFIVKTESSDLGFEDIDPFQSWTEEGGLKFGSAVSTPSLLAGYLGTELSQSQMQNLRAYYFSFPSTGSGKYSNFVNLPIYRWSKDDLKNIKMGMTILEDLVISAGSTVFKKPENESFRASTVHIFGSIPCYSDVYLPGTNRLLKNPLISVSDASLLPFPPGVNPQAIVMSLVDSMVRRSA